MTPIHRRELLLSAGAVALGLTRRVGAAQGTPTMYGLIGKLLAVAGKRDELIGIVLEGTAGPSGTSGMPGCLSYIIARDPSDDNAIWITEVWDSEASHKASLTLPAVRAAIAKAQPLIAGAGERFVTAPAGGIGLGQR